MCGGPRGGCDTPHHTVPRVSLTYWEGSKDLEQLLRVDQDGVLP